MTEKYQLKDSRPWRYPEKEISDMMKLSAKWVPRCLIANQKRDRVLALQAIWADFGGILWDFLTVS
jgi:hypothetical protein